MNSLLTELRKVPMLALAAAVAAGVTAALYTDFRPQYLLPVCASLFGTAVVCVIIVRSPWFGLLFTLLALGSLGMYRATMQINRDCRTRLAELAETCDTLTVNGRVHLPSGDSPQHNSVVLSSCEVSCGPTQVKLKNLHLRVFADSVGLSRLRYGDYVYALGRLSPAKALLGTRGVLVRSLVQSEAAAFYADSTRMFSQPVKSLSVRRMVDDFRDYARRAFQAELNPDASALCAALLLGDRSGFGPAFTRNLRLTGLSHIFALSGMNTGLVVLLVWIAISWLPLPHAVRLCILLGAVLLYMEVGREAPSLARSSLAASAMIIGQLLSRRAVFLNLVLAAMFVELLWKPLDLVDAGFLLSYLAVFGIVGSYSWLRRSILSWWRRPAAGIKMLANITAGTASAQIGTLPMVAFLFQRVPLTGVVGNLLVVPGFAFLLVLAVLLLILYAIAPWAASLVGSAADAVAWILTWVVDVSAALPLASLRVAAFGTVVLILLITGTVLFFLGLAMKRRAWMVFATLLVGNLIIWRGVFGEAPGKCQVTFIDVENGNASLISAGDRHVLVDAGPRYESWSAAQRIMPVLMEQGVDRLDAMILSHPDNDHIGGAPELLAQVPVQHVYVDGERSESRSALEVELAAQQQGLTPEILGAGSTLVMAPGVLLTILAPDSARLADRSGRNEKSMVIRLDAGESSMLLPADIDSMVESDLGNWGTMMDVDVIESPHHGSKRSTSRVLLTMTTPDICVISSGIRNPFGHPAPEVLERLSEAHIEVHNTAQEGNMVFRAVGEGWRIVPSATQNLARKWNLIR